MKYKFEKVGLVVCVVMAMLLIGFGTANDTSQAFQSPVPTTAPTPAPDPGDGDNGNGGAVEFPDVDFDPTVLAVVLGLVQYFKSLGVNGKGSLALSMVSGVLFGGASWVASAGTPVDFVGWFGAVLVGLAYGLTASGLYDLSKLYRPS